MRFEVLSQQLAEDIPALSSSAVSKFFVWVDQTTCPRAQMTRIGMQPYLRH